MKPAAQVLLFGVLACVVISVIAGVVGAASETPSTALVAAAWSDRLFLLGGFGAVGLLVTRAITQDLDERIPAKPKRSDLGVIWSQDQAPE